MEPYGRLGEDTLRSNSVDGEWADAFGLETGGYGGDRDVQGAHHAGGVGFLEAAYGRMLPKRTAMKFEGIDPRFEASPASLPSSRLGHCPAHLDGAWLGPTRPRASSLLGTAALCLVLLPHGLGSYVAALPPLENVNAAVVPLSYAPSRVHLCHSYCHLLRCSWHSDGWCVCPTTSSGRAFLVSRGPATLCTSSGSRPI